MAKGRKARRKGVGKKGIGEKEGGEKCQKKTHGPMKVPRTCQEKEGKKKECFAGSRGRKLTKGEKKVDREKRRRNLVHGRGRRKNNWIPGTR